MFFAPLRDESRLREYTDRVTPAVFSEFPEEIKQDMAAKAAHTQPSPYSLSSLPREQRFRLMAEMILEGGKVLPADLREKLNNAIDRKVEGNG